jgi:hypothetical protein
MALGEVIACATLTSRRHGAGLSGSATQHWRGPLWGFCGAYHRPAGEIAHAYSYGYRNLL